MTGKISTGTERLCSPTGLSCLRFSRQGFLLLIFVSILLLFSPSPSLAAEKYVLFILDTSSSMGGGKLQLAKQVILQAVRNRPRDTEIALRVFNQGFIDYNRFTQTREYKETQCTDSEMILSFNEYSADTFMEKLSAIKIQGLSPIAITLDESRYDFFDKTKKNSIILITDGSDTCDGIPCDRAKFLRENYDIEVNVIGISVSKKNDEKELLCIADATGGTYINTNNECDLFESVFNLLELPRSPLVIVLVNKNGEKILGNITIFDDYGDIAIETQQPLREFSPTLPIGEYSLEVKSANDHQKIRNVTLEEGKPTELKIELEE